MDNLTNEEIELFRASIHFNDNRALHLVDAVCAQAKRANAGDWPEEPTEKIIAAARAVRLTDWAWLPGSDKEIVDHIDECSAADIFRAMRAAHVAPPGDEKGKGEA